MDRGAFYHAFFSMMDCFLRTVNQNEPLLLQVAAVGGRVGGGEGLVTAMRIVPNLDADGTRAWEG